MGTPDFKYTGEWFLPEGKIKLSGRLTLDHENKMIKLELYGEQYLDGSLLIINNPNKDKRYNSKEYNHDHTTQHTIILGKTQSLITLYNCWWDGTEELGSNTYLIRYQAKFGFFNAHIRNLEELQIESGRFIYPYLSTWFDGSKSLNKLDYGSPIEFKIRFDDEKENDVSFPVTNNLNLLLFDHINQQMKEYGVHHETKFQKYIEFKYSNPVTFKNLLNDAIVFKRLLEFCHGKPLRTKLLQIHVKTNSLIDYNKHFYYSEKMDRIDLEVINFSLHRGEEVEKHSQHQNFMLLSAWNTVNSEMNIIIQKWFANESMFSIYDYYLDSNNWFHNSDVQLSPIMFRNRFLNIVQGIEAFYREVLAKKSQETIKQEIESNLQRESEFQAKKKQILESLEAKSELKSWFNSHFKYKAFIEKDSSLEVMLRSLMKVFQGDLDAVFGKTQVLDFFPRYASVVRNRLSHGNNHKEIPGKELPVFFHAGQILLAICILRSLDIKDIAEKIRSYDTFSRYIIEIQRTKLQFK